MPRTPKPNTKAKARSNLTPKTNQIHLQTSDYESDINSLPPPGPLRTNVELNFSVLAMHLPLVAILSIVPYAVIYHFSKETQAWEKNGVEGTLFVCSTLPLPGEPSDAERYEIIVLNRRGLNNFQLELTNTEDVEISGNVVILQDEERAWGVWVFEGAEPPSTAGMLQSLGLLLKECAEKLRRRGQSSE